MRGARQTGKTYILREFGRREYRRFAYLNFEEVPELDDFFARNLEPRRIIENLSLYVGWTIEPEEDLLILDEIQESNGTLNALKYFHEKANEYHIAAAGSLLGLKLSRPKSFPVGKVNFCELYPMTFLEFLESVGKSNLKKILEKKEAFEPYPKPFHDELLDCLRKYFFVGGMPEAVESFRKTGNLLEVREIQKEITDSYVLDFSKHASTPDIPRLAHVWESIPTQLGRENKKFMFSAIRKSARARQYESAIEWLKDAGLIYMSHRVSTAKCPLKGYIDRSAFKVFALDVGLLGAIANVPPDILVRGDRIFREYEGAFVENYVAQQLRSEKGMDLYYWKSEGKKAEVDFLCEHNGEIYPLEAKAGVNPRSKSLKSYDNQFSPHVLSRTTLLNLKRDGKICNYPLYAITLFPLPCKNN
jgi:predicted AAA+ superfamily ATPase